jgi:hypothetical protein
VVKPYQEHLRRQFILPLDMKGMRKGSFLSVLSSWASGYTWSSDEWWNVTADDSLATIPFDGAGGFGRRTAGAANRRPPHGNHPNN